MFDIPDIPVIGFTQPGLATFWEILVIDFKEIELM